jgi:hypothetical protein
MISRHLAWLLPLLAACSPNVAVTVTGGTGSGGGTGGGGSAASSGPTATASASSGAGGPDAGTFCGAPSGLVATPALWGRTWAGSPPFEAISIDGAGKATLAGTVQGQVDLGTGPIGDPGQTTGFVAGYDAGGAVLAVVTTPQLWPYDVVLDLGDAYVTGLSPLAMADIVLEKPGNGTTPSWVKTIGTLSPPGAGWPTRLAATSGHNLVLAGATTAAGQLDAGAQHLSFSGADVWLIEVSPQGDVIWASSVGPTFASLVPSPLGLQVNSLTIDAGGNIVVGGITQAKTGSEVFLARFDPGGALLWTRGVTTTPPANISGGAVVDAAGRIAMSGTLKGTADFGAGPVSSGGGQASFLALYDPSGTLIGVRTFPGGCAAPGVVGFRPDGLLAVLGGGDPGVVLAGTLDPVTLAVTYTSASALSARSWFPAALAPSGHIVIAGALDGPADFGQGPVTPMGPLQAFIAGIKP